MSSPSTPRSAAARQCTIQHSSPVQVAVCGAIGTVGTLTVHALLGTGVNLALRAGCEREMMQGEAVKAYEGLAVQVMELDYGDDGSVEALLTGVERVFVILPWRRGMPDLMRRFLQVAVRCGVRFILKMSSAMTDLQHSQQPLPQVVRDVLKFMGDVIRTDRSMYGLGKGEAAFIDARDVADCVVSVLLNPHRHASRRLVLTGKEAVTGEQMAVGMSRVYQTTVTHSVVDEQALRAVLTRRSIPAFMQDDICDIERLVNEGTLTHTTNTVKEVAGHPPRTLETFLAHYRHQLMPTFSKPQLLHFFL